ncbi:TetR/AcrR family transcriptional regulator [Nocardioides kribbensis]|uniref:TetR/AcrR family transcriptional regulator n=1 Tax=Nocardioides kribbensis TaxID=305517 RepID=UPI00187956C4|nr:TetR/AcrR family transcriptional regulator [Nocardioides kribbensis]
MARPRVYDDRLRGALVAAAAASIAEGGVDGLSLRAVAAAAGTSTNAVYTLFGGKEHLVAAVLEEASEGFAAAQRAVGATDDALADLLALGHAYRDWALAHPELYTVLMGGRVRAEGLRGRRWVEDPTAVPLVTAVRRAGSAGLLRSDDPEQVAVTLWAGVHGMVSLEIALWDDLGPADRARRFADHLVALAYRWCPSVWDEAGRGAAGTGAPPPGSSSGPG